jgi:DNA-binding transcriptional LysR family regulator
MDEFTIKCFLAVAQTGSFTKAAALVKRTQSAITQQMNNLEKTLGKKLFERNKTVELTKDGEQFLPYANKIYSLHLEVLDRFKEPDLEGELRLGLPEDFAAFLLSDVITEFTKIHPRILLHVECDLTLNLIERFHAGHFDMVLVKMEKPQDVTFGVELWTDHLEWVKSENSLFSFDKNEPLPLILSPQPCIYRGKALQSLQAAGIPWRIVFISPSYSGQIAAAQSGIGMTVLPKGMIPHSLKAIKSDRLPSLPDIPVSLLKRTDKNKCLQSLEQFLLNKLDKS